MEARQSMPAQEGNQPGHKNGFQSMDINKMLNDLRAELGMIEQSIVVLERIAQAAGNVAADRHGG
jgi:hypothetical protein